MAQVVNFIRLLFVTEFCFLYYVKKNRTLTMNEGGTNWYGKFYFILIEIITLDIMEFINTEMFHYF